VIEISDLRSEIGEYARRNLSSQGAATRCANETSYADLVLGVEVSTLRRKSNLRSQI